MPSVPTLGRCGAVGVPLMIVVALTILASLLTTSSAFRTFGPSTGTRRTTTTTSGQASGPLFMVFNSNNKNNKNNNKASASAPAADDPNSSFMRWARTTRSAQANDVVVELVRPLGLVLAEDERGNVYVETVAPNGNAARSGMVKEGDIVAMCSATFGDDMWSTRGVGLARVLQAIRVRSGATVKLVLESPRDYAQKRASTTQQIQAQEEARKAAQAKRDVLLKELEQDEDRWRGQKKFFGLF